MNLGGYKVAYRACVPVWVAVLLGVLWGFMVIRDFDGADEYEADGAQDVYLLYVDREMRMLDGAAASTGLMRWYFEVDEAGEMIEDLLRTLDEGDRLGVIGLEGQLARAVLHWKVGEKEQALEALDEGWVREIPLCRVMRSLVHGKSVAKADVEALVDEMSAGRASAWEAWGLRMALQETGMSGGNAFDVYETANRSLARRAFLALVGTYVLVLGGLVCVPFVWVRWRVGPAPPVHRVAWLWGLPLVFAVFFISEFSGDGAAGMLGLLFGFLEEWSVSLELVYDTVWRATPVVVMAFLMFNRPTHMPRVFRMMRPGHWMSALAVLALLWSWDWVLYFATGGEEVLPVQPTDFIYYADPTMAELGLEFFSSCITAPLVEEIMFRGLLFMGLRRALGPWGAIAVSSILFGLIHWQYDIFGVFSVMLLGAANAVLVWRTGSLFPAIVVHAVYNFLISVMVLVSYQLPL